MILKSWLILLQFKGSVFHKAIPYTVISAYSYCIENNMDWAQEFRLPSPCIQWMSAITKHDQFPSSEALI